MILSYSINADWLLAGSVLLNINNEFKILYGELFFLERLYVLIASFLAFENDFTKIK